MTLRLIIPADEQIIPRLLNSELVEGARPIIRDNEKDGSPGFQASEFQAKQVAELLALGMDIEKISKVLMVKPALLQFYYANEFDTAEALVNAKVARVALDMALSGRNPEMTQFWLRSRAGWMETKRLELTGADGGPVEITQAREGLMKTVIEHEDFEEEAVDAKSKLLGGSAVVEDADVVSVATEG